MRKQNPRRSSVTSYGKSKRKKNLFWEEQTTKNSILFKMKNLEEFYGFNLWLTSLFKC